MPLGSLHKFLKRGFSRKLWKTSRRYRKNLLRYFPGMGYESDSPPWPWPGRQRVSIGYSCPVCPWRYPYPGDKRTTYVRRTKRVRLLYVRRTNTGGWFPLPPHFADLLLRHAQEGLSASSELPEVSDYLRSSWRASPWALRGAVGGYRRNARGMSSGHGTDAPRDGQGTPAGCP